MLAQTWAIFYDAYRSVNAKRLFWIVLILSGMVVATFALLGIDAKGLVLAGWHVPLPVPVTSADIPPGDFYKGLFAKLGIRYWLAWIATILALISTAGIFPDLIASGAIDLVVSKPIGRLRLFITQYLAGLLFVTLQVGVFSVASFLVIGLRGGVWEPGLFVAVPIVVCLFSYLFSVCVLVGIVTRSTVAALLLTMLFWVALGSLAWAENGLLLFRTMEKHQVTWAEMQGEPALPSAGPADGPGNEANGNGTLARFHAALFAMRTALPKTEETLNVLERSLAELAHLPPEEPLSRQDAAAREFEAEIRGRSAGWSIGTSLGFECIVLALAAFLFCRRDF